MNFTMKEVCKLLDVWPDVLRNWHSRGLLPGVGKKIANRWIYSSGDVERIRRFKLRMNSICPHCEKPLDTV